MNKTKNIFRLRLSAVMLTIAVYGVYSCNNVSEAKIKNAVLENEKKYFSDKNESLQSIKVDSLHYTPVSEKTMLLTDGAPEIEMLNNDIKFTSFYLRINQSSDSAQTAAKKKIEEDNQKIEALQYFIDNSDSVNQSVYKVDYFLDYKKDNQRYYEPRTLYLKANNLEEYNLTKDFKKN